MQQGACACRQGRVACEIASGDELITSELIFSGVLTPLSPAEAAALLSALVFQVCPGARNLLACWWAILTVCHQHMQMSRV